MREIKFRAWNRIVNRMSEPNTLQQLYETKGVQFQNLILLQSSGIKDKNGKEIYEGDWLRCCVGYTSTVEFRDAMFVSVYKHPEDGEILPLLDVIGKDTEVIGNIYETI